MFQFNWNIRKNEWLKENQGIGFEKIVSLLGEGCLIDIKPNPSKNFSNQQLFIIEYGDYVYVVPFVRNGNNCFLKTIFPSRKETKKYLKK
jgi:hypothetical protein